MENEYLVNVRCYRAIVVHTGRDDRAFQALLLCDLVDLCARGHAPSKALDAALLEVGDRLGRPVGDDSYAVTRSDERALAVDHVPVTVAVTGGTEVDVLAFDPLDKFVCVCQVRIGVASAEVGERYRVLYGSLRETERVDEDSTPVRTSDTVHTVEENFERVRMRLEEVLDEGEVEDGFEELDVVRNGVDDLNVRGTVGEEALLREVDRGKFNDLVAGDRLRLLKDLVGDILRSRTAVRDVVLDAEIRVRASGVVAGGEKDTAIRLVLADDVGSSGSREDGVLADDELGDTVRRADLQDGLDGLRGEEATVSANNDGLSVKVDGIEDSLDEVLGIVLKRGTISRASSDGAR